MGEPKTSERRLAAAEKQRQALELRKRGKSFEAIATELGYASKSGAYKAVASALQKTLKVPAAELRQLELERLDAIQEGSWDKAAAGDRKAAATVLAVIDRRIKLLGLATDPPAAVAVAFAGAAVPPVGVDHLAEVAELLSGLGLINQPLLHQVNHDDVADHPALESSDRTAAATEAAPNAADVAVRSDSTDAAASGVHAVEQP